MPPAKAQETATPEPSSKRSFARFAAILSCWLPFAVTVVGLVVLLAIENRTGKGAQWSRLGVLAPGSFVTVSGLSLGLVALVGMKRQGRKGILARALIGIVANGLLIWFAVASITTLTEEPKDWPQTLETRAVQIYGGLLESFRIQERIIKEYAARQDGDAKAAVEALSKIIEKQRALTKSYYAASQPLFGLRILDMSGVRKPEDIQPRKELLLRFLEVNGQLGSFCFTNAEQEYRQELVVLGVSPATMERMLVRFHKELQAGYSIVKDENNAWKANERWARNELGALSLLQTNWGKWSYDASLKKIDLRITL